jgi:NitT/TauT family transport system permease protein
VSGAALPGPPVVSLPERGARARGSRARSVGRAVTHFVLSSAALVALVAGWELGVRLADVAVYILPAPSLIFSTLVESAGDLASEARPTLFASLIGLAIGAGAAFVTGVLVQRSKLFELTVLPFTVVLQSVPIVAVTPIIALIFGRGSITAIVVVSLICYFPVLVNAVRGLLAVSDEGLEFFHVVSASRNQELRMLRLPTSLPFVFGGLRVAAALAIPAALVAEWTTSNQGLGYYIVNQAVLYQTEFVWAGIVLATALTAAMFILVVALERVVLARLQPARA